jgi:hypothetical protein
MPPEPGPVRNRRAQLGQQRPQLDHEVARLATVRALAEVAQQAAADGGGPGHRRRRLAEQVVHRGRHLRPRQLEVALDDRQQVVELVGDAAGHRLEALVLAGPQALPVQLPAGLVGAQPRRDVEGAVEHRRHRPAGIAHRSKRSRGQPAGVSTPLGVHHLPARAAPRRPRRSRAAGREPLVDRGALAGGRPATAADASVPRS